MLRKSLRERRAVIPTKHFYEWDKEKTKTAFFHPAEPVTYLAGFWNAFSGEKKFVVLTTEANTSMSDVHNRMPVLLQEKEIEDWLEDDVFMELALRRIPYLLSREAIASKGL